MRPLLEVDKLNVEFATMTGTVYALNDISFSVAPGDVVGIVGESGSGKSTVVWSIARLLSENGSITSGSIRFNDKDVTEFQESELQAYRGEDMSIVFQDPMTSQNPVHTYATQMRDIQYRRNISTDTKFDRAVAAMKRVGIADADHRVRCYPHEFSGGMRQRASIAMAIMMDPALLIADEATTALDVTMEAQIIHLIRELKSEIAGSVIVVSHNLGMIAELCDHVVVMYAGRIVERGTAEQIFHRSLHPYTQALLECDPARILQRSRRLPTISGDVPRLSEKMDGCSFAPRCQFVQPACTTTTPVESNVQGRHAVYCHLYNDHGERDSIVENPRRTAAVHSEEAPRASRNQTTDEALLAVDNLNVRYETGDALLRFLKIGGPSHVDAVLDASIRLHKGETLGLVGESGSGKTSLGRGILRLVKTNGGDIHFDGNSLCDLAESRVKPLRKDMALMFQDPVGSLSPRQTVRSLLIEPFQIFGIPVTDEAAKVKELLNTVGLPADFAGRYPHELSGGQARRVGVARALALNPKLVVADEPTAGLDVSVQGEILNLMASLQEQHGLSYLIISHNLPVIRHICDRVAIMYLGRIVEQGDCDDVFDSPAHPYTKALVSSVPQPDPNKRRQLSSIEGEVPSVMHRPNGCEFHPRCEFAQEICRSTAPELTTIDGGRQLRCHFPIT